MSTTAGPTLPFALPAPRGLPPGYAAIELDQHTKAKGEEEAAGEQAAS
jgi:hypothetical protein